MAKNICIKIRNWILGFLYRMLARPVFFMIDAQDVHDFTVQFGNKLGTYKIGRITTALLFNYQSPILKQTICGIEFKNPVGLAAGFDKDAYLTQLLPEVGFGYMEVGSITGEPCAGNPRPWMWRLPKSKSLLVNYGLKNEGCEKIAKRLSLEKFQIPLGINIAKTNSPDTVDLQKGIDDYLKVYRTFTQAGIGDYFTLNISCPNTYGGEPFAEPANLKRLLEAICVLSSNKPVFIKLSPDLSQSVIDQIIKIARQYKISGFVCSNLTKEQSSPKIRETRLPGKGGLSGKVVEDLANEQIEYIYRKTHGEFVIIGCGGVFSAKDAYKKIKLGASLIQQVTGMIFEGPQLVSEINQGLVKLLKKDGFNSISEAIGIENK